jgi:predicted  nucleic acid-binding Zn-ribbon protein
MSESIKEQTSRSSDEIVRLREHIDRLTADRRRAREEIERYKDLIEDLQKKLDRTVAA